MDDKCHLDMLGLMILCSLLTGTSGHTDIHVFISDGGNASLPCYSALTDCTSTSWIYSRDISSVVLFENGMLKNGTERRERLSLGSDCSLNIYKATTEDCGVYDCRQSVDHHSDISVHLHVLHVSPSSTQTEIRPGSSFTLSCQLYVDYGWSCNTLFTTERIQLVWVNKAGVNLQSDPRFQISSSPERCISTLTTTLLNEDDNTEWRCQITDRTDSSQVKTSVGYTVTYLATQVSPAVIPVAVTGGIVALLTLIALIALWLICKKRPRADNEAISTLTPVTPPAADVHGKKEDVAYAEVIISRKKFTKRHNVQSECEVTYATISGAKAGPRDEGL